MIRVALSDDHPLILKIVQQELAGDARLHIAWTTTDSSQIVPLVNADTPDVLVLDLSFAGQGFEPVSLVRDLCARFPRLAILVLTSYDDPMWIEELLDAGVKGYVVKSDDFSLRVADGVRAVAQGRTFLSATAVRGLMESRKQFTLTARERAILRLAAKGQPTAEMAAILGIAPGTVRNHLSNIYTKLGVSDREGAVRAAQNLRELPRPGAHLRHEIRTPLHTLIGLSRLLQTKLTAGGDLDRQMIDELLQQIILEAERLDGLIGDLT